MKSTREDKRKLKFRRQQQEEAKARKILKAKLPVQQSGVGIIVSTSDSVFEDYSTTSTRW